MPRAVVVLTLQDAPILGEPTRHPLCADCFAQEMAIGFDPDEMVIPARPDEECEKCTRARRQSWI